MLTCSLIEGVSSQSECDAAAMAGEAASMEELPLSADPLQHVDPLSTEVTLITVCQRHTGIRPRLKLKLRLRTRSRDR